MLEVILTSVSDDLTDAWSRFCGQYPGVRVHEGSILDVACDAVVSPANSFGFMDGGIDAIYLRRFGREIQGRVQTMIERRHGGELVVGMADIVETGQADIPVAGGASAPSPSSTFGAPVACGASAPSPFLVVAPTMRVPMVLRDTVNPYLAARAVFRLLLHGTFGDGPHVGAPISEHVRSVAFPGLGTGVGQVSPNVCARQVAQAIEDVLLGQYLAPRTWAEASTRHQELYGARPRRLQHGEQ